MSTPTRRIPLKPGDLYHQDLVEIIARETRRYGLVEVNDPDDPLFPVAYRMMWDVFGPRGELETAEDLRGFLREDPFVPGPGGSFLRYFLIVATDREGRPIGVRDGTILVNPAIDPRLCVVYLSRLYVPPEARGTALSLWLRIAPVEIATRFLGELGARGLVPLPAPDDPDHHYGMQIDLVAEMSFFHPDDRMSWQRLVFYGRGGFEAVDPADFPYLQPDFREGGGPLSPTPFALVVRRMGREGDGQLPVDEATAITRLLFDDFASFCTDEALRQGLGHLVGHLAQRGSAPLRLLPLPVDAGTVDRLRPLFRDDVYQRCYRGLSPEVDAVLAEAIGSPDALSQSLGRLAEHLASR
ncbi:MAG: hypothetical protein R3F59_02520 [Myxococcota bacterium]